MVKAALAALMGALALSAVATATASASPEWYNCMKSSGTGVKYATEKACQAEEHPGTGEWEWMVTGGEKLIVVEGGGVTLRSHEAGTEIVCTATKAGIDVYNEAHVGKGDVRTLAFTGCTFAKPSECGYVSSTNSKVNGTIEFAGEDPVELAERTGEVYLEVREDVSGEFVKVEAAKTQEGATCGVIPRVSNVTGSFMAKVNDSTKRLELEGKSGEKPLKVDGFKAEIETTVSQNPEKGPVVRVGSPPSPPEWGVKEGKWEVKEGGSWTTLEGGASRNVTVTQQGTQTLTGASALEITCESMQGKGSVKSEGEGEESERKYTGCKAVKPSGCGYVSSVGASNGTIQLDAGLPTQLVSKEGIEYDEVKENATSKAIADLRLEQSEGDGKKCGLLTKESLVTGSFLGAVDSAGQTLEFTGLSGASPFKLFGLEGKYKGNEKLEVEAA